MKRFKNKQRRLVTLLSLAAVGMLGFGYALVPLYNALCKTLGLNGKTNIVAATDHPRIDKSRDIRVEFIATNNANLPWDFRPNIHKLDVHPGENYTLSYYARNNTDHPMTIQAIPSITPGLAAAHFKKTECFCFTQQTLKPHEARNMKIVFHIDNELPKRIHEVTLSYTLFKAKLKKG